MSMEALLRSCYKEMNIWGVNKSILEKRENAITDILNDNILDINDYSDLTNWLVELDKKPEDTLIKLEEYFCKYDEKFTLQGTEFQNSENKEIEMLCMVLLYQYCVDEADYRFPLKILCGIETGYRIKSQIIEQKFEKMIAAYRISQREEKPLAKLEKMFPFTEMKKRITESLNDEADYDEQPEELQNVLEQIEKCQKNIKILSENEETYMNNMKAKSEESNLLWWIVSEWCECYQEPYRNLTIVEAALTIPLELDEKIEFKVYPYATVQIVRKMLLETGEDMEKEYSLDEMIRSVRQELTDNSVLDYGEGELNSRIQPVLYALKARKRTESENDWKALFRADSKNEMADIKMTAVNFSLQLCRELELLRYMQNER